jgi:5'-deoxynucleotidase YfbR-like HD superfamily hydrolase
MNELPNMEVLLTKALIHDVDEAFSGDVIRMFHRDGGDLERLIHDRAGLMVRRFVSQVTNNNESMELQFMHNWEKAKDKDTVEGCIVAYADFLSVLSYVVQEVDGGNRRLLDHLADIEEYAESFSSDHRFDFLWEVVEGHRSMVTWLKNELNTRRQG